MAQHIQVGDLPRITEIARVLAKHGFGHIVRQAGFEGAGRRGDRRAHAGGPPRPDGAHRLSGPRS
jgi:hypothetical protein